VGYGKKVVDLAFAVALTDAKIPVP